MENWHAIKFVFFENNNDLFWNVRIFGFLEMCFWVVGVFCSIHFLFLMRLSDPLSFSVYEHIFKIVLSIFLKNVQKCEQFSYELFVWDLFGILGPKWSPPSPSPASLSKFPSWGKICKTIFYKWFLMIFMKTNWNMVLKIVLKRLRRVAFVVFACIYVYIYDRFHEYSLS